MTLGYTLGNLREAGLANAAGYDTFSHRVVFPLETNLYGRSIPGCIYTVFYPAPKAGSYGWDRVDHCPEIIVVEGLFDLAVLWQAGIPQCHLRCRQSPECATDPTASDGIPRTVYLAFDSDANGSGQQAKRGDFPSS